MFQTILSDEAIWEIVYRHGSPPAAHWTYHPAFVIAGWQAGAATGYDRLNHVSHHPRCAASSGVTPVLTLHILRHSVFSVKHCTDSPDTTGVDGSYSHPMDKNDVPFDYMAAIEQIRRIWG